MEIKPTYVTFEQAKWLKEKGFKENCDYLYSDGRLEERNCIGKVINKDAITHLITAPEQWQVVEWLRVNHDIWVSTDFSEVDESFTYKIHLIKSNKLPRIFTDCGYDSPQEAYSAAFDYILNNLI
jgi:hypothetical protein